MAATGCEQQWDEAKQKLEAYMQAVADYRNAAPPLNLEPVTNKDPEPFILTREGLENLGRLQKSEDQAQKDWLDALNRYADCAKLSKATR